MCVICIIPVERERLHSKVLQMSNLCLTFKLSAELNQVPVNIADSLCHLSIKYSYLLPPSAYELRFRGKSFQLDREQVRIFDQKRSHNLHLSCQHKPRIDREMLRRRESEGKE